MMLSFVLILASILGTLPPTKALEHKRGRSANFKIHENSKLNLDANETKAVLVHNINECGFECVKNYFCLSFNFAIRERHHHFLCEVLANDKYNEPSKFVASKDFHHYSIVTPCLMNPCKNSGKCIPRYQDDTYTCSCVAGYTGNQCQKDIDDCSPNPCQNGGKCTDGVSSYNCICQAGYEGSNCQTNIDECAPNPCQNNGTCTDGVASYNCSCIAGFNGTRCENNIDDCAPNPCQNNGTCTDGVASYNCSCIAGFNGTRCENNIDECAPNPCQNNGTCTDGVASYNCSCIAGFNGTRCENNIDDCSPNPCQNGEICTDGVASYNCTCQTSVPIASDILGNNGQYQNQLTSWLSPVLRNCSRSRWVRCWRGTSDGFAASTFHAKCDNKGPTVTIVQVGSYVFGGYTDQSWTSSANGYRTSYKSFLFTLYNTYGYRPQKLTMYRYHSDAIYDVSSYGPTFGGGHDLYIIDRANTITGSYTNTGYSYYAPYGCSHGGGYTCSVLAGSYSSFTLSDIEVFYETI